MAYRGRQVALGVALLVTLAAAAAVVSSSPDPSPAPSQAEWAIPKDLRSGDLVFRQGRDMLARLVLTQGQSARFSHVGLVRRVGDQTIVIHAMPDEPGNPGGVLSEPLESFAAPAVAQDLAFYRVAMTDAQGEQAVAYATAQIGKPFDTRFQMATDEAIYCTELVLKSLHSAGTPLKGIEGVQVLTVPETAYPPDALRASKQITQLNL